MFVLFGMAFGIHLPIAGVDADHGGGEHDQQRADHAVEHRRLRGRGHRAAEGAGRRARASAGGFAIAAHIFNILWITVAGFGAMWALRLSFDDVFSFGTKPAQVEPAEEPRPAPYAP